MFCQKCGNGNYDSAKFCSKCGANIAKLEVAPSHVSAFPSVYIALNFFAILCFIIAKPVQYLPSCG